MMPNPEDQSASPSNAALLTRTLRAGLLTGVLDGLFASALSVAVYHSTVEWLFQGVASALLGPSALKGGTSTEMIGILMHFCVAFFWSIVFLWILMRASSIRNLIATPYGVAKVAAVYGPFIWITMSLLVIPLLTQRPPSIASRWWIQLIGHFPFVGLPIVASARGLWHHRGANR